MAARTRTRRRRSHAWIPITLIVLVLGGGYVTADVYDIVPGPLTLTEPWPDAEPYPSVNLPTPEAPAGMELAPEAPVPNDGQINDLIADLEDDSRVGDTGAIITDALSGDVLGDTAADDTHTPASTTKVLTAVAALNAAGPHYRFTTEVTSHADDDADAVTLIAGGDLTLAEGEGDPAATIGHAGLADLAEDVAETLREDDRTSISRVVLDESLWSGPRMAPHWDDDDLAGGWAMEMSPIAIELGTIKDELARSETPGMDAAEAFAQELSDAGITVESEPETGTGEGDTLGSVESAPLHDLVAHTLIYSENVLAESLGRLVAVESGTDADFDGAGTAVLAELDSLGVETASLTLADTSGLSSLNEVSPRALEQTLRTASDPEQPQLLAAMRGLPVAGLEGTLADRFDDSPAAGVVAAKTGSLRSTATMAGQVHTDSGRVLIVVAMANDWSEGLEGARAGLDDFFTEVAQL